MATRGASLKMVKEIHTVFDPFGSSGVTVIRYTFIFLINTSLKEVRNNNQWLAWLPFEFLPNYL